MKTTLTGSATFDGLPGLEQAKFEG